MYGKIRSLGLYGMNAYQVEVEVSMYSGGLPKIEIVGLPDAAVRESRERIRAALQACGKKSRVLMWS